jgi:diadenosine tetraphosphatase ApaH/serine/threonine PP2A family protein phosphatase
MWAVLSDIHANLEALDAVLADVAKHPVSHVYCLGDTVGYGPNPVECLDRAMAWDVTLLGEFDQYPLYDDSVRANMLGSIVRSAQWTRAALDAAAREPLWDFLTTRPRKHTDGDFLLVHGSARNPLLEYIFPEDVYNDRKMTRIGELLERFCLCGHTHVPGVFLSPDTPGGQWEYRAPAECHNFHRLTGRKAIINVGSVGQPRDGEWRACYVLVDGWDVTWRRVGYDVEATVRKIHAIPEIDDLHGDRLREGR